MTNIREMTGNDLRRRLRSVRDQIKRREATIIRLRDDVFDLDRAMRILAGEIDRRKKEGNQ